MGIHRGHRAHLFERLAEWGIFAVSFSTIGGVFLIFFFVGKEALPVAFEKEDSALVKQVIPPSEFDSLSQEQLQSYLGLSAAEFAGMDRETLQLLMEIKV